MPYLRIWIHLIWSTKNRRKLITKEFKPLLLEHLRTNAIEKDIYIDFINCVEEHCHLTVSLGAEQSISDICRLLKGESSHWVNKNKLLNTKFEWQDEYIAVSVSESQINRVRDYIKNQEVHHRKMTFQEEYDLFIEKYGFKKLG